MAAVPEFTPEKVLGSWVPLTTALDATARWQAASSCSIQTPSPHGLRQGASSCWELICFLTQA